jgi:glyoxylase-like metal-dependent hydrolase (beta-lactamase superfamily II)
MTIQHVLGNTYCIDTGMTYIPFYLMDDRNIIMLDTGWAKERAQIEALFQEHHYHVKGIICTHSHIDHIGNNQYFKEKYGASLAMSKDEAHICSSIINLKLYYSRYTLTEVEKHYGNMVCDTDVAIEDTQTSLRFHGVRFGIFHSPGHSPGHICILTPDNVAYLGDALISDVIMNSAKLPYAHVLKRDLESKESLKMLTCHAYIVAHKLVLDNIDTLIDENIAFYKMRASKVLAEITEPMTMEDIMKRIVVKWSIHVSSTKMYIVIERMLRYYVEYLNETGQIESVIDCGFLKYRRIEA